jgi:hypothetical protein
MTGANSWISLYEKVPVIFLNENVFEIVLAEKVLVAFLAEEVLGVFLTEEVLGVLITVLSGEVLGVIQTEEGPGVVLAKEVLVAVLDGEVLGVEELKRFAPCSLAERTSQSSLGSSGIDQLCCKLHFKKVWLNVTTTLYKVVKKIYSIRSEIIIRDSLRSRGLFASEFLAGCSTRLGWWVVVPLNCIWKAIGLR